jgi:hypothetical protein
MDAIAVQTPASKSKRLPAHMTPGVQEVEMCDLFASVGETAD